MQTSLGIIEGFYGKLYSKEARNSLLSFASNHGFSYYIYAPKNDKELRRNWKDNFSKEKIAYLKEFSSFCHKQNMAFGIGISPLEISNEVDASLPILLNKIDIAINEFKTDIIAILFDDIKLYTSDEGIKQNFIVNQIFEHIKDKDIRLIFCPTYYSFDPILDKVFGKCPENYFEQIVEGLNTNIEVFWTGNKVLSKSITKDDIEKINALFKRKVTIWDNYPVNDGKFICKKIYTREFSNRTNLDGITLSHAVNPMLEAELTKISIATLPLCYKNQEKDFLTQTRLNLIKDLFKLTGNDFKILLNHLDKLNDFGIDEFTKEEKDYLFALCCKSGTKVANDIIDFLNGVYAFDPACLTS